jgi:hypothetical protein
MEAKRLRRETMIRDGYSEWEMNRAEAQRVADNVSDAQGVTQSVFNRKNAESQKIEPKPQSIADQVAGMTTPVVLVPPHMREFLPASIPGVTVCRPWADPRSELYVAIDQ